MLKRDGAIVDPIGPEVFRRARFLGSRPVLQEVGQAMTATTGRPRVHSWETLFFLLALAATIDEGKLLMAKAVRSAKVLTPEQAEQVGLTQPVTYRQMEAAVTDLAAGFGNTLRVNRVTGEVTEIRPPRIPMSLDTFTTRLVAEVLPRNLRRSQTVAIDSTDAESHFARQSWTPGKTADAVDGALPESEVELPEKRVNRRGYPFLGPDGRYIHCYDKDVREGYRSGKNFAKKQIFLGMDIHLATTVPELGEKGFASLFIGAVIRPAGDGKGEAGIALMDSMAEARLGVKTVLADRGYTYLKAENWADKLMERGIEQVLDLHKNQRGTRPGPKPGTIWVDGSLFVDALPKRLRNLPPVTQRGLSNAEKAQRIAAFDERDSYAFKPLGPPDLTMGKQRVRGPAADGRLRCPNYPRSMNKDSATRPTTTCAPGACSCGAAPTLGPNDRTRERQATRWGTTAWVESYGRRSGIESGNASAKKHHGNLVRGSTRVLGRTRTTLLLAFILAVVNIRILLDCYGHDPGLPHSEDAEVHPLPTLSQATHRKRRPFAHRHRRSPVKPNGPPSTHPDWKHANAPTGEPT